MRGGYRWEPNNAISPETRDGAEYEAKGPSMLEVRMTRKIECYHTSDKRYVQ
jgi:hypothetical protein